MIRIGVDVGGTNTDAVVMKGNKFLGGAKSPTTEDILTGVENAIQVGLKLKQRHLLTDVESFNNRYHSFCECFSAAN